jgi:hypothetical protein
MARGVIEAGALPAGEQVILFEEDAISPIAIWVWASEPWAQSWFSSEGPFCFDFDGLLADGDLGAAVDATAAD